MGGCRQWFVAFLLIVTVSSASGLGLAKPQCNPNQGVEICIKDVVISKDTANPGDIIDIKITVGNVGNETGDAVILLGINQPQGGFDYAKAEEIHDLGAGKTRTIPVPFRIEEGEPVGVHELNIMLFDRPQQHLYDATGYYQKVVVEKEPFKPVEWFKRLGIVARAILAIIALFILFLTGRFVWG